MAATIEFIQKNTQGATRKIRLARVEVRPRCSTHALFRLFNGRAGIVLIGIACFLGPLIAVQLPFLTGARLFFHDSLVGSTSLGLFYDRFFSGDSWLWSSSLNAGHPLWMDIEIAPLLDPVVVVVYLVSAGLKFDWQSAYQITAVLWHLAFALGGALCARRLTGHVSPALLAGLLLWAGPLMVAIPGQSWGFLLPFRYLPLIVFLYLRLRDEVSTASILYLVAALAFSLSSYQSAYLAVALALLLVADLAVHRGTFLRWLGQVLTPSRIMCLGIPILAALPTLVFLNYSETLTVLPRHYQPDRVYFFDWGRFLSHLLFPYSEREGWWHGSAVIGLFVLPLLVHGARKALEPLCGTLRPGPEGAWFLVLLVWFAGVSLVAFGGLGLAELVAEGGSVLGIRNFGFLLTCQIFLLAQLAAFGFHKFLSGRFIFTDVAINVALFGLFSGLAGWAVGFEGANAIRTLISLTAFTGVSLLLWRLRVVAAVALLAPTMVVVAMVESLALTSHATPSLAETSGVADRGGSAELVAARRPRFQSRRETFVQQRAFEIGPEANWPFSLLSPAVFKSPSAYQTPLYLNSTRAPTTSHFFRLQSYEDLVSGSTEIARLREVLGVTRPVLELVPPDLLSEAEGSLLYRLASDPVVPEVIDGTPPGDLRVTEFAGDRLVVETESARDTVLVYRDNMAPGWSVRIDGREAEMLVVDRVNKAVALPAGRHEVVFVYRPWLYLGAFALRAMALIAAALALALSPLLTLRDKRRRNPHRPTASA